MARGWESKAADSQIQDASEKTLGNPKEQLTTAQVEGHRRREVLLLSRTRVESDLRASQNPRYTNQLTRALADLDAQLAALGDVE
jgi:hypothetical protein